MYIYIYMCVMALACMGMSKEIVSVNTLRNVSTRLKMVEDSARMDRSII